MGPENTASCCRVTLRTEDFSTPFYEEREKVDSGKIPLLTGYCRVSVMCLLQRV